MKIIFFGVSKIALDYLKKAKHKDIILAFADNRYEEIQNAGGHLVIPPESILEYSFDYVVIDRWLSQPGGNREMLVKDLWNRVMDIFSLF